MFKNDDSEFMGVSNEIICIVLGWMGQDRRYKDLRPSDQLACRVEVATIIDDYLTTQGLSTCPADSNQGRAL